VKTGIMIICLVLASLVSGCGEPFVRPNIRSTQTFNAPYDEVWRATVQTFTELSYHVSVIEKDSGFIGTTPHVVDYGSFGSKKLEQTVACPNIFCAIWTHLRLHGNANVTVEDPNQTRVKLNTTIAAYNNNEFGGGGKWYQCYSKGLIERNYLKGIEEKVNNELGKRDRGNK